MWDLSSPPGDGTCGPCVGSTEPHPLDQQGHPLKTVNLKCTVLFARATGCDGRSSTEKCVLGPHSHKALNSLLYVGVLYCEPMYQLSSGQLCEVDAIVIPILQIRRLRPGRWCHTSQNREFGNSHWGWLNPLFPPHECSMKSPCYLLKNSCNGLVLPSQQPVCGQGALKTRAASVCRLLCSDY